MRMAHRNRASLYRIYGVLIIECEPTLRQGAESRGKPNSPTAMAKGFYNPRKNLYLVVEGFWP